MVHFTWNRDMNIFMYILLYEPKALHRLVHLILTKTFRSKQSYEYIPVYPSLGTKIIASSCTFDFVQYLSPEAHDIKGHTCEPYETTLGNISISPNLVSPSIPS